MEILNKGQLVNEANTRQDKLHTENVPEAREDHNIMTVAPHRRTQVVVSSALFLTEHHDGRHFFPHGSESWKSKVKVPA